MDLKKIFHIFGLIHHRNCRQFKNRKGKDAFEFIEVYNTTQAPISLKHYQLRYRNPAQGIEMDDVYSFHTNPVTISPGKPYVFWLRKKGRSI